MGLVAAVTEPVLTDQLRAELQAGYDARLTIAELAARYGISETSVRRALPSRRRRGPRAADNARTTKVVTLRDEAGCSFREIAAALGIPENTAVTVYYRYVNGRGAT